MVHVVAFQLKPFVVLFAVGVVTNGTEEGIVVLVGGGCGGGVIGVVLFCFSLEDG